MSGIEMFVLFLNLMGMGLIVESVFPSDGNTYSKNVKRTMLWVGLFLYAVNNHK